MGQTEIQVILRSDERGCMARGVFNGHGVIVFAGSQASLVCNPASLRKNQIKKREQHLDRDGVLKKDLYFGTPSGASDFIMGETTDGWEAWTTPEGVKLSAYRGSGQVSGHTVPSSVGEPTEWQNSGQELKQSAGTVLPGMTAQDRKLHMISPGEVSSIEENIYIAIPNSNDAVRPDLLSDAPSREDRLTHTAEIGGQTQRSIADLKQFAYDDLRALFRKWCRNSGFSPSAYNTFVSDCFYLWRKENPARFWLAVESDDAVMYDILYRSLKKNSGGDADKNVASYVRGIRRFRQFSASWLSGEENAPTTESMAPAQQESIRQTIELAASGRDVTPEDPSPSSPTVKTPEINSRLEKKTRFPDRRNCYHVFGKESCPRGRRTASGRNAQETPDRSDPGRLPGADAQNKAGCHRADLLPEAARSGT